MEQYQQTDNSEEKAEIIDSFCKFKKLPKKQQQFFKAACDQEPNMEIRMKLVKMLAHFRVNGMGGQGGDCGSAFAEHLCKIAGSIQDT